MATKKKKLSLGISVLLVVVVFESFVAAKTGLPDMQTTKDDNLIDFLPNQPEGVDFLQYSGYITVNEGKEIELFYYFAGATGDNPTSKPLILCFTGHEFPISSIASWGFQQYGPFRISDDGNQLTRNPHAWNQLANFIFVESPAGVGFSKAADPQFMMSVTRAIDIPYVYNFLFGWFERFPEFRNNDFYLAGQGSFGVSGPKLAQIILANNHMSNGTFINLKGLLIGNANFLLSPNADEQPETDYMWYYGMISDTAWSHPNCVIDPDVDDWDDDCMDFFMDKANMKQNFKYNIYQAQCPNVKPADVDPNSLYTGFYECFDYPVSLYLNTPSVQRSLHVESNGLYLWPTDPSGEYGTIPTFTATQANLLRFNWTVQSDWRPWFVNPLEVAGYAMTYKEGLTFATVRNSGSKVGLDQPERAFTIFKSFLDNTPLPSSPYFPFSS
ncbi:Serine carboxypeptidase-like 38 [Acorus gramineus]|uniref:Serine carboxypeptidase-like 38 n=1 Tax=Acorus gramineus TaxID=55184 RepID=A0AAV9ABX2_ACOGR|nr:Serine carboxypeptidase-like 38 [Acorus gramineus]